MRLNFYYIFHSKNLISYLGYMLFYLACFYFSLRNILAHTEYGLTFLNGSVQHFTYQQLIKKKKIGSKSICISIITHPQHRIVSSFYFLGYAKHYTFLEFLKKIDDGSLIASIPFSGFKAIIKQHLIPMHQYITNSEGDDKMDFIFKRELLDNNWKEFCKKYKLPYHPLRHINKTNSMQDWKDVYKIYPEAAQLVFKLYKKDFNHFGYQKIS